MSWATLLWYEVQSSSNIHLLSLLLVHAALGGPATWELYQKARSEKVANHRLCTADWARVQERLIVKLWGLMSSQHDKQETCSLCLAAQLPKKHTSTHLETNRTHIFTTGWWKLRQSWKLGYIRHSEQLETVEHKFRFNIVAVTELYGQSKWSPLKPARKLELSHQLTPQILCTPALRCRHQICNAFTMTWRDEEDVK